MIPAVIPEPQMVIVLAGPGVDGMWLGSISAPESSG